MFKVINTGKRKNKGWKRMVTKPTFVYVVQLGYHLGNACSVYQVGHIANYELIVALISHVDRE